MSYDFDFWVALILGNFGLAMFLLAIIFIILHKLIAWRRVAASEIIFRWISLFALGFTSLYAYAMNTYFPHLTATNFGWSESPFQWNIAMASLALGLLGIISFRASYGFRLATVIAAMCLWWGDALFHLHQNIMDGHFNHLGASWFLIEIIVPIILLWCIIKLRPGPLVVYGQP